MLFITLGVLLSISYVISQLSKPIDSIVNFIRDTQDAKIASKRLSEIQHTGEENIGKTVHITKENVKDITIKNLSFKYPGKFSPMALHHIDVVLPRNSVTALVGVSGSGKTTMLKLLLSYYTLKNGAIFLGKENLNDIFADEWRKQCGIVLQDGNIFSGTIAENIALSDELIDLNRIKKSCKMAEIDLFIKNLPLQYYTKIGNSGMELSGGQRQRILIARAVYKNPNYLFFDEAASALDAENEKKIHKNLQTFFKGKTVAIIAHRLSTVKNADQIIMLEKGKIVERGTHSELVRNEAAYFDLVKNQLELGK